MNHNLENIQINGLSDLSVGLIIAFEVMRFNSRLILHPRKYRLGIDTVTVSMQDRLIIGHDRRFYES